MRRCEHPTQCRGSPALGLDDENSRRKVQNVRARSPAEIFGYIEVFYNQRRRHSTLGQIGPAAFKRRAAA